MDEARVVLERLERIEELDRAGATGAELLAELRALVRDAEGWSRREGGDAGASAVARLRDALGPVGDGSRPGRGPVAREP